MFKILSDKRDKFREKILTDFQQKISYIFKDEDFLDSALIHRSYVNETKLHIHDNERLEFLGDSVLALVVNEYIFKKFPLYHEGELAKIKAKVVSEDVLAKVARNIGIGDYLLMGRGEDLSGGRLRDSILSDAVEAVIGAIYLDSGLKSSRDFILSNLKPYIRDVQKIPSSIDPKSSIQEFVQKKYKEKPEYKLISETGPDHCKNFEVALLIKGREIVRASGSSIRRAEASAAEKALEMKRKGTLEL